MKTVSGGITAPAGFLAAGAHIGIKKAGIPDCALIVSERTGPIAGVFTTNRVVAAPVVLDRRHLRRRLGRAVIINSGNANACTGPTGLRHAEETARLAATALHVPLHTIFVCSTGVIGQPLPMARLRRGVPALLPRVHRRGGRDAARAILTTDTTVKEVAVTTRIGGRRVTMGGMAKGSGMIHPDMATMLAFVTTDAMVDPGALQRALSAATDRSFNCISVDGDTSTNDTVLCLANGMAGNAPLRPTSPDWACFQRMMDTVCHSLALQICRDGEGMTKLVTLEVRGARSARDARQIGRTVATSSLVKTALFGEDANWGRLMAAIGRAGVPIDPSRLTLFFDSTPVVQRGAAAGRATEQQLSRIVRRQAFTIQIDLGLGRASAVLWTTDLSYDYVRINASYRS